MKAALQIAQTIRRSLAKMRDGVQSWAPALANIDRAVALEWGRRIGAVLLLFCLAYYPIGMMWLHQINDDLNFAPTLERGGSKSVSVVEALIDREVNQTAWVANDPFFYPGVLLDNMPNFQMGVISACARFSVELADQIGRTRGASPIDADLNTVKGELQYRGTRWIWDFSETVLPSQTSESHYRVALKALRSYNDRLSRGEAVFEKRADNLLATLDRIALDIGSASADLDEAIKEGGFIFDLDADDVFYSVKGQLYAYLMILRGVREDFSDVIVEKKLEAAYAQMLESFEQSVSLSPWIVTNAAPDAQVLPSHLAAQGFYLLRARTQLREISDILLK